ncbi:MAG: ornithine cyclodeaminase family protein [Deltaproteobacteria bacterium]|jgi:ornithine cyclodeaminase|nr:ornithine cyclodeaminase family protein [Deltaproteobacteria bacterium]
MLILGEQDILKAASLDEVMAAIEKSYAIYADKRYFMPHRIHVDYKNKNLLYMPCIVDDALMGTKYLTIMPENIEKRLPSLDGLMILNDYDNGKPLCVMNGTTLTALRTGAVGGGVGLRHTAPDSVSTVGLIGTGVQGFYQLKYAVHVRKVKKICLFDAYAKNMEGFAARLKDAIPAGIEIKLCKDSTELLRESEVIITTTTATSPVLPEDPALLKGKHYIAVGSYKPTMRELPDALYSVVDHIFIDAAIATEESGDLSQPLASGILSEDRIKSLGDYIHNEKNKDAVKNSTTLFKTVGIGIFDVVVADLIYRRALQDGAGHNVAF